MIIDFFFLYKWRILHGNEARVLLVQNGSQREEAFVLDFVLVFIKCLKETTEKVD